MFSAAAPVSGPLALLLLPLASAVCLGQAGETKRMHKLLLALALTWIPAVALLFMQPTGESLSAGVALLLLALASIISLYSPFLLVTPHLQARVGPGGARGRVMLTLAASWIPLLFAYLGGGQSLGLVGVPVMVMGCSMLGVLPLLHALLPVPELQDLAASMGLYPTWMGWRGNEITLTRQGRLKLSIVFPASIPGLFAAKRGQRSTLPLLGDAVLDQTLELSLPGGLAQLAERPALLLEAVHGAGARVTPKGISMDRTLDKAAIRADPRALFAQVLSEVHAVRALARCLTGPSVSASSVSATEEQHPKAQDPSKAQPAG